MSRDKTAVRYPTTMNTHRDIAALTHEINPLFVTISLIEIRG